MRKHPDVNKKIGKTVNRKHAPVNKKVRQRPSPTRVTYPGPLMRVDNSLFAIQEEAEPATTEKVSDERLRHPSLTRLLIFMDRKGESEKRP
jgi:hypothetical protein